MFLFKKSKIVIDAFTYSHNIHEFYKIEKSSKFYPDWWKEMESSIDKTDHYGITIETPTIKRCDGILEYYRNGFILPSWCDMTFKIHDTGDLVYDYSDKSSMLVQQHSMDSFTADFNNLKPIKIVSPWILKEKTGVNFLLSQPFWNHLNMSKYFIVPPGILNFKYQNQLNINVLFDKQPNQLNVSEGTPLAYIIPLSDKEIVIKTHLIDRQEFNKEHEKLTFTNKYIGGYKLNKKKHIEPKSKCPFKNWF